jgi:hypothetical protein
MEGKGGSWPEIGSGKGDVVTILAKRCGRRATRLTAVRGATALAREPAGERGVRQANK